MSACAGSAPLAARLSELPCQQKTTYRVATGRATYEQDANIVSTFDHFRRYHSAMAQQTASLRCYAYARAA